MPIRIGDKFHRLEVLGFAKKDNNHRKYFECICDCGERVVVRSDCLKSGNTKACGCLNQERTANLAKKYLTTHGESKTRLYSIWKNMHDRCRAFGKPRGKNYADRGIAVCQDWGDYENFRDWAMANGYKDGLSIDRINVDGDYEPSNCRWATQKTQNRNKRETIYLTHKGVKKPLKEWAEITGIKYHTLYQRYKRDKNPEFVLRPYRHGGKVI